ncbi:hypothetical protein [Microbacterium sp. JB110]|uniref:hypothetical protein n=1 Tax=Microbacterium sp. JB110 TaxID=2024477 RepID=UPI00097EB829|nr:hypothetical protein [Microbacterium sp. JB110]RCS58752.1 hypothetical protein CIK77_13555 [Microbacterium sp. JB110]SJM58082.1 D-alanyl-D-alanine carboxypeptidase [Frigoribacterium sp. JB110]
MPTDDVNNADETPRASQPAAEDSSEPEQLRAMSLSDLEPDTDEDAAPRRMTRREARARRQQGDDDAALPVSTRVGGAFRSRRSKRHAPDESDAPRAQAPDEATASAAEMPHEAPDAPADDIDDDTRANPIATSTPAAAADAAASSGQADSAAPAAEDDLTHVASSEASEASGARDGTSPYEPEPTVAMPVAEVSTVAMDATMIDPAGAAADEQRDEQRDEAPSERPALAWVSTADIVANDRAPRKPKTDGEPEPLVRQRRRSAWPVLAPILTAVVLAGVYVGSCAAWPLDNVTPTVEKVALESPEGPTLEPQWPEDGGAAVAAVGHTGDVASSSSDERPMASITKLVSVLMVLDQQPLESGEQGPSYAFTWDDQNAYWGYASRGESRLEVPVDGSLTQYQMLQGVLLGSANNWIDRLVIETFGSIEEFAAQAPAWLEDNGLTSMTVVQPSGIDWDNTSSPADVARLGALALEHPVVAEIVQQKEVELPGAGLVENSNPLIDDEGVVGLKTGTLLNNSNLVVAKEVDSAGETVTVVASILGQPDNVGRDIVARTLLEDATAAVTESTLVVPGETIVGSVTTAWGESADLVTPEDLSLVLWDGDSAEITTTFSDVLGRSAGDEVGDVSASGSFVDASVRVDLSGDISGPELGWRLTHPLELLGLS